MIHIEQAIIVEGKYDKIKLSSILDAVIIVTNGFRVFSDSENMALIRRFAETTGVIILTDSDSAGFRIRNYLKGAIKNGRIINVYIPDIFGKERRKQKPSAEGKLGVEGVEAEIILNALKNAGVVFSEKKRNGEITRADFYEDGLMGGENSSMLRRELLKRYNLPERLSTSGLLEVLNTMSDRAEYKAFLGEIKTKK